MGPSMSTFRPPDDGEGTELYDQRLLCAGLIVRSAGGMGHEERTTALTATAPAHKAQESWPFYSPPALWPYTFTPHLRASDIAPSFPR